MSTLEYDAQISQFLEEREDKPLSTWEGATLRRRCAFSPEKHKNGDARPSCEYNRTTGEVHCWVCDKAERRCRAHIGELVSDSRQASEPEGRAHQNKHVVAEYLYQDSKGVQNKKVRYSDKTFLWFHIGGGGKWVAGRTRAPLKPYRHERIEEAKNSDSLVLFVEGEKDVYTAESLGYYATNLAEITKHNASAFDGIKQAVFVGDNDEAGQQELWRAVSLLRDVIPKKQVLEHLDDVGPGGDLTDWVEAGFGRPDLDDTIEQLPFLTEESRTDLDNAKMFAEARPDSLRWAKDLQCWFVYNKAGYWQPDHKGEIVGREFAKVVEERIAALDATTMPGKERRIQRGRLEALKNVARINAALAAAKFLDAFLVEDGAQLFDSEAAEYLVNFRNGTYDLRTGSLREHRRQDYITAYLDRDYNPNAICPKFRQFILDFANGDESLARWLLVAIAMPLLGVPRTRVVFFMVGLGGSGKSTVQKILKVVYGHGPQGYSVKVASSTFYEAKFADPGKARGDIVRLWGKRLYLVSEIKGTRLMDHELQKDLSGGDDLAERPLYEPEIEFTPRGVLFFSSNHEPRYDSEDDGMWKRLKIIPAEAQFVGEGEDKSFAEHILAEELDCITSLLIATAVEFVANGRQLPNCDSIEDATFATRDVNNPIENWFSSTCVLDKDARSTSSELYDRYKYDARRDHVSQKRFYEILKHVYKLKASKWYDDGKQVRGYDGVRFRNGEARTTCPHGVAHGMLCEACATEAPIPF